MTNKKLKKITLTAPAKLNLNLHILPPKDRAGFYDVRFLNCQLSLADKINLKKQPDKIEVSCRYESYCRCIKNDFCRKQKNLIVKAAEILKEKYGKPELGVEVKVEKHIPPSAGLAGGSADAAAVLQALVKLWKMKVTEKQLLAVAREMGMDVQYCLMGGLCEVAGRKGEKVKPSFVPPNSAGLRRGKRNLNFWVLVIVPEEEKPSTAWAYRHLDEASIGKSLKSLRLLKQAIRRQDFAAICQNLHNDFEPLMLAKYPVIGAIRKKLLKYGASGAILAGSGLAMVGFFKTKTEAKRASQKLKKEFKKVFLTNTL